MSQFLKITEPGGTSIFVPNKYVLAVSTATDTIGASTPYASGRLLRGQITSVKYITYGATSFSASQSFAGISAGQGLAAFDPRFTVSSGGFQGKTGGGGLIPVGTDCGAYDAADTFAVGHYSKALITGLGVSSGFCAGVGVRMQANGAYYGAILSSNDGGAGASGSLFLNRYGVGGGFVAPWGTTITNVALPSLLELQADADNATLRIYVNNVLRDTVVDTNITGGKAGVSGYGGGAVGVYLTNWVGGDLSGPSGRLVTELATPQYDGTNTLVELGYRGPDGSFLAIASNRAVNY